jgi:nucleotide-binding universal stress UspA family protein
MGQTDCPILFTRHAMHDFVYYKGNDTKIALNRILFATDFAEFDSPAKRMAIQLARDHQAELLITHSLGNFLGYLHSVSVNDVYDIETRIRKDAIDRLQMIANDAQGVKTEMLLTEGRTYDEILRIATERDMDLIIIGTGGKRTASTTVPGRNAERVVRGAPCPVLTIRHGTLTEK